MKQMKPWLTVVGMGDDGPDGLAPAARAVVEQARVVVGGQRHLHLVGHLDPPGPGERESIPWPKPFGALTETLDRLRGRPVCVLATGDPTCYGVGSILAERFGCEAVRIIPAPSAFSLARARLGWAAQEVETLSLHGRPLALVQPFIQPGARLLVLSANASTPVEVARVLRERGYGRSRLTVLSHLGGGNERMHAGTADSYRSEGAVADLNTLAIECVADPGAPLAPRTPGLADELYEHDGQLTKHEVRAITLAALGPVPGQLLWDVGAGCGSIGIEWMRTHPECRAVAIEPDGRRLEMIAANSAALGVPGIDVVNGRAIAALEGLAAPDAVFVGGGITEPGLLDVCRAALGPGGRLVANVVSVEGEAILDQWQRAHGGSLTRIAVTRCEPLGRFRGWRPMAPVTQLVWTKPVPRPPATLDEARPPRRSPRTEAPAIPRSGIAKRPPRRSPLAWSKPAPRPPTALDEARPPQRSPAAGADQ